MLDKEEINKITHVCSISNHPVSKLPMEIRENYLQGLRAILPMSSPFMDVLFRAWEISILGEGIALTYDSSNPKEKVKTAIKLNRIGWRLIRLAYPFFFDCFYLTTYNTANLIDALYEQLVGSCNQITKKALQRVYEFFKDGIPCGKIPIELRDHRNVNLKFASVPLKRILVVANVSAGKSTLINALIGKRVNKIATTACTKDLCYIFNKPQEDGLTIKQRKTGEIVYESDANKCVSDEGEAIGLHFVSDLLKDKKICLIDTPGFNDAKVQNSRTITEKAIKENDYDILVFVANGSYLERFDEQHLLEVVVQYSKKPIVFVMNQLDRYDSEQDSIKNAIEDFKKDITSLGIKNPLIIPVSAKLALLIKLENQNLLNTRDKKRLDDLKEWVAGSYYDLPTYVDFGYEISERPIYRTGLCCLEEIIQRL